MRASVVVVIPARYRSERLPGKPLADICGKPMIQRVYEQARQAQVDRVIVATDDERIMATVEAFGGEVMLTSREHPSGTDRVAEVARSLSADIIVNVQGDEPLLPPQMIDQVTAPLLADRNIPMSTLAHPMDGVHEAVNPDVVKVVCSASGFALYFSRSPIPYMRDYFGRSLPTSSEPMGPMIVHGFQKHVGLYAYRADFLQTIAALPPTFLESMEKLEQLRVLEHGYRIRVVQTFLSSVGVDTQEDLERVRRIIAQES